MKGFKDQDVVFIMAHNHYGHQWRLDIRDMGLVDWRGEEISCLRSKEFKTKKEMFKSWEEFAKANDIKIQYEVK